jgi:hypothetical protein
MEPGASFYLRKLLLVHSDSPPRVSIGDFAERPTALDAKLVTSDKINTAGEM